MQQPYPKIEEIGKPDRSKSKSTLSLLWEEFLGPQIDLQGFVDSCWNNQTIIDINFEEPEEHNNNNPVLTKPHLKDSGTSSLNDEDQFLVVERGGIIESSQSTVSVKSRVQQFSNGIVKLDQDQGKWHLVVQELIETEKIYLKSLTEIEEGYLITSNIIFSNDEEVNIIFSNWQKLRVFHKRFLDRIRSLKSNEFNELHKLSQCFIDEVDQFESLYSEYCTNYSQSVKHLHLIESSCSPTWKGLIQCHAQIGHQLPLSTFLLKPVQRILKYHLLFKELIQCCKLMLHANTNDIIESLLKALENMVQVANRINERQIEREDKSRRMKLLDELYSDALSEMLNDTDLGQPYLDGEMKVPGCKNSRVVLLCQNALVLAKRLGSGKWDVKQLIKCNQMMLFEYIPKQPLEFHVVDINDNKNKAFLQAGSPEDKEMWCKMIKQLIIGTFDTSSISERAKRILLDKKCNVLAQNQPSTEDVLEKFHINLNPENEFQLLDPRSQTIFNPISSPLTIPTKNKSIKRRNSVGAIKSESSKTNFRDPSIYQSSSRRHFVNHDDNDYRSITIDVNEENLKEKKLLENNMQSKVYESYIGKLRTSTRFTVEDIQEICQPLQQMPHSTENFNMLMSEIELASICSDPDLDSIASDTTANGQHKRKSTSMDRNFGISLYAKANSFTNNFHTDNPPPEEFINNSHRKKPLFSSVRETKSNRRNSDWGSLFDVEAKSGIVKRFFKASVKLTKRDKSKSITGTLENNNINNNNNNNDNNNKLIDVPISPFRSVNYNDTKRRINKSNSIDYFDPSQRYLEKVNDRKKKKAPAAPEEVIVTKSQIYIGQSLDQDNNIRIDQPIHPEKPLKPPRQLPQFRIEMFDKPNSLSSERIRSKNNYLKPANTLDDPTNGSTMISDPINGSAMISDPINGSTMISDPINGSTMISDPGNVCKVKDLVSIFQSDK